MNKKQAKIIVNKSLAALGIDENMKTDPRIITSILRGMKLDDFQPQFLPIKKFLDNARSEPQTLHLIIQNIRYGIINKHPAIIEFCQLALAKGWFKRSHHITRAVHETYILEAITAAMCNNHSFFIEAQDHYRKKEKEVGINPLHTIRSVIKGFGLSHSFFETFKSITVDPLMLYYRLQRGLSKSQLTKNEAKKLLKAKKINYIEYRLLSPLHRRGLEHASEALRINIYEAGIKDYTSGFTANAIAAHELSEDLEKNPPYRGFLRTHVIPEKSKDAFYRAVATKKNEFSVSMFSQGWVSMYETWNLAFVLGNIENLDLVIPKLLLPSVINARPCNYIDTRIVALWLTINHVIFRKSAGKKVLGPRNKTQMAQAWGEINKKYALALAKKETHEDPATLFAGYHKFYSHPLYNILKIVRTFL